MLNVEAPLPAVSHESLIQGDGRVRLGGAGKAGAAGGGVRVQGELGHHQQGAACLLQIQIHFAVFILKDPQVADFLRQAVGGLLGVVGSHAQQHQEATADPAVDVPGNGYGGTSHPCHNCTHTMDSFLWFTQNGRLLFLRGISAMLTAVQMRPHSLFVSAKKRTRRARYKRKRRFGRNFTHACKVAVRGAAREGACVFAGVPRRARRGAVQT